MLTQTEILKKAQNKYKTYLKSKIYNQNIFPLEIRGNMKVPENDYDKATSLFQIIYKESKFNKKYGYTLLLSDSRKIKISKLFFETEIDYLKYLSKEKEVNQFIEKMNILRKELNISNILLEKNLSKILKWDSEFTEQLSKTIKFLLENPNSGLYPRELPIDIPTKFIEKNLSAITSFLNEFTVLSDIDNKYQKLGLIDKDFLIYIRSFDEFNIFDTNNNSAKSKIINLNPSSFSTFSPNAKRIFVIENKTTFFTFPLKKNDICLYSGGFSILSFKNKNLINSKNLYYFGDIDEHGLAILSLFREIYPNTKSIFMDIMTLKNNLIFSSQKGTPYQGKIYNLTAEEIKIFEYIRKEKIILEQEKIPLDYIIKNIENL